MAVAHGGGIFAAARELGCDWRELLDFSASINPLGPPPGVFAAITDARDRIAHYPDPQACELSGALAAIWGVQPEQILVGNGATELLHFLARTAPTIWPQNGLTIAVPAFSEFHRAYPGAGLASLEDMDGWPEDGWLILTRPANPTGSLVPYAALAERLRATTQPVIVDESFLDFTDDVSVAALLSERDGLFILRSLTKFYALPGLRVGALLASEATLARLRPVREPWQVNVFAQSAAIAAIRDRRYAEATRSFVRSESGWLRRQIDELPGTATLPPTANYIAVRLRYSGEVLVTRLRERCILIRDCGGWPGVSGEMVRVAVRTRIENQRLVAAWSEVACGF
jgi:threonine-phosphate decarboxylase